MWEDPSGSHGSSPGQHAGGWDPGAGLGWRQAEGLRCILEAELAGVGDGNPEQKDKKPEFRFSPCPVQENPREVVKLVWCSEPGLGWKNGDSEGFASKKAEQVGGRSEWRNVYKGAAAIGRSPCTPQTPRPWHTSAGLKSPSLFSLLGGCPSYKTAQASAAPAILGTSRLRGAPGLAVLPAFLLSPPCPCLSPRSPPCQALSTPGAELHPPQLFILELGTKPGVEWVPNR